jgi:hypothetical protein
VRTEHQGEGKNIRVSDGQTVEQNPRVHQEFSLSKCGHGFSPPISQLWTRNLGLGVLEIPKQRVLRI